MPWAQLSGSEQAFESNLIQKNCFNSFVMIKLRRAFSDLENNFKLALWSIIHNFKLKVVKINNSTLIKQEFQHRYTNRAESHILPIDYLAKLQPAKTT